MYSARSSSSATARRRVGHDRDVGLERLGFGLGRLFADCFEQSRQECSELELVEQHADLFSIPGALAQVGGREVDLDVGPQPGHLAVEEDTVAGVAEVLALLGRQLVEVLVDALEVSVRGDELRRGLLADAGNAGEVVARVTPERGVVGILRGGDAPGPLDDACLVVEHVIGDAAAVVEHLDVGVTNQLVRVAVAGDDHGVDPLAGGLLGEGGDDVVGLDPLDLEHRDLEGVEDLVNQRHLGREDVRRLLTAGLVVGVHVVPERRRPGVEGDGDVVGLLVAEHLDEHRREPVDGVRDRPRPRREVGRQGVEGPERKRVAVEEEKLAHSSIVGPPAADSGVSSKGVDHGGPHLGEE